MLTDREKLRLKQTIRDILCEEGMSEHLAEAKAVVYLSEFEDTYESLALFAKLEGPDNGSMIKCTMTDVVMILATSTDDAIRRECITAWLKILRQVEADMMDRDRYDLHDKVAFLLESEVRTWFGGKARTDIEWYVGLIRRTIEGEFCDTVLRICRERGLSWKGLSGTEREEIITAVRQSFKICKK